MIEAYARMIRSYMVFRGRTSRSSFWSFVLVQSAITVVALILGGVVHDAVGVLLALYLLATLMPMLAGIVRRLHDTGRGFWWLPLGVGLAPVAMLLFVLGILLVQVGFIGGIFELVGLAAGDPIADDAAEAFEGFLILGLALLSLGVITTIAGGALAIVLIALLAAPGERGENKYGPQP